jgi:enoyl-CoA hydratase/carnithine racemase
MSGDAQYEDIVYEVTDPVALVRIDRPEVMNAFRGATLRELRDAFTRAERDPRVVGIVLTATGDRAFSSGLDAAILVESVGAPDAASAALEGWAGSFPGDPALAEYQRTFTWPMAIRKPVIAAVNGVCAGGGLMLALGCDLRFAAEHAWFTTVFAKRGLVAEHGISWLLPRLIGTSRALDLLWSARRVEAAEALGLGLVDRVVPADELETTSCEYIEMLARTVSPHSLMMSKRLVYRHLMAGIGEAVDEADAEMEVALARPDAVEGAHAFFERRDPRFDRLTFD